MNHIYQYFIFNILILLPNIKRIRTRTMYTYTPFSWINALINISELLVLLYIYYTYMCICLIILRLCYIYVVCLYMLVFECSELRNDFIKPLLIYDDELLTRLIVILFMMIYLLYVHLWNYEIYVVIIFQDRH